MRDFKRASQQIAQMVSYNQQASVLSDRIMNEKRIVLTITELESQFTKL